MAGELGSRAEGPSDFEVRRSGSGGGIIGPATQPRKLPCENTSEKRDGDRGRERGRAIAAMSARGGTAPDPEEVKGLVVEEARRNLWFAKLAMTEGRFCPDLPADLARSAQQLGKSAATS